MQKRYIHQACLIAISGLMSFAHAADRQTPPPPNSIDLAAFAANLNNGYNPNVVIDSAPYDVQPQIVPNTSTIIQQQVTDYRNSQLTPQQVQQLKEQRLAIERVTSTPYNSTPIPIVRSLAVSLNPGETPPLVRVSKNLLTTIVFTDNDGNPWYIKKVAMNRNQFSDAASIPQNSNQASQPATNSESEGLGGQQSQQSAPINTQRTNILTLEPLEAVGYSNISVTLEGKSMPVIFLVSSGQPEVDIRVDAKIPGRSPDAPYTIGSFNNPTPEIDNNALAILDGTIPDQATALLASDHAVEAWQFNDSVYLKTRLDVLYPSYTSKASSPNGLNIYRFNNRNLKAVTLTQRHGQPVTVTLEQSPYRLYEQ